MNIKGTIFADGEFQISVETEVDNGWQIGNFRHTIRQECAEIMIHLPEAEVTVEFETDGGITTSRAVWFGSAVTLLDN
jgi:hypothetical protein